MSVFDPPIKYNDRGQRVRDAQWLLNGNNFFATRFYAGSVDGIWGRNAMAAADQARWLLGYPELACKTGLFGPEIYGYLINNVHHVRLPTAYRLRRVARLAAAATHQIPVLPSSVSFPNASYAPTKYAYGLQPWIVPQVNAIVKRFGLTRVIGWGTSPPHGYYSDHRWGGAVDLLGSTQAMIDCTLWADGLCSGFYRKGSVFRWVGGPAHDANGVEPGHYNHCHLSWFRLGPATTVFGTPGFPR